MPNFSEYSKMHLSQAHPDLQRLFNEVIKHFDCKVLDAIRTVDEQKKLVAKGASKTMNSKHIPRSGEGFSRAVDVAPYPIDWKNKESFYYLGGFVLGMAKAMGINIRQGHDWDGDNDLHDQSFFDGVHYEIKE